MKLGLSIKLDVSKIDKARLFKGEKGTYLDLTTFIDLENLDQYDNNGFIAQSVTKEERQQNIKTQILGNVKVFYNDSQTQQARQQPAHTQQGFQAPQDQGVPPSGDAFSDTIPF